MVTHLRQLRQYNIYMHSIDRKKSDHTVTHPSVTYPALAVPTAMYLLTSGRELLERSDQEKVEVVPLGYFLTEMSAGRVEIPEDQRSAFARDIAGVTLLTSLYLAEAPLTPLPSTLPRSQARSRRQKEDSWKDLHDYYQLPPSERYALEWDSYRQDDPLSAWRLVLQKPGDPEIPPFDIYRYVRQKEDLIRQHTIRRWREHGSQVHPKELPVPRIYYLATTLIDAVLIELWWLIQHDRTVRPCLLCHAPFVPTGDRHWKQQYCSLHRTAAVKQYRFRQRRKRR
jgi:hypothetical protein